MLIENIATFTSSTATSTPITTFSGKSTLTRLKKLNFKNYAAPGGYGYGQSSSATKETMPPSSAPKLTPLLLKLTSVTPTTSRSSRSSPPSESPSAPNLSSNTMLEMSSPTLSTTSTTSTTTSRDSTPVLTPMQGPGDEDDGVEGWKIGDMEEEILRWSLGMEDGHFGTTLIPFPTSSPTAIPLRSPSLVSIPGGRNTTFSYFKSGGVPISTSPPPGDLQDSVVGRGVTVGSERQGKCAYGSTNLTNGGGGSGLMPPQRRRRLPQTRKRGSGSSTSSGSDSNSKNSTPSTLTPISTATLKSKPPKLDLPSPTYTPPTSASVTSPSDVQSPYPRRDYIFQKHE